MACLEMQPEEHVEMRSVPFVICLAFISRIALMGMSLEEEWKRLTGLYKRRHDGD